MLGICQGHENMAMYVSDLEKEVLQHLSAQNVSLTVEFIENVENKLFDGLDPEKKKLYETEPVLQNAHNWGISPD